MACSKSRRYRSARLGEIGNHKNRNVIKDFDASACRLIVPPLPNREKISRCALAPGSCVTCNGCVGGDTDRTLASPGRFHHSHQLPVAMM